MQCVTRFKNKTHTQNQTYDFTRNGLLDQCNIILYYHIVLCVLIRNHKSGYCGNGCIHTLVPLAGHGCLGMVFRGLGKPCTNAWLVFFIFNLECSGHKKRGPVIPQMRCLAFQLCTPFYVSIYIEPIHLSYDYHVQYYHHHHKKAGLDFGCLKLITHTIKGKNSQVPAVDLICSAY